MRRFLSRIGRIARRLQRDESGNVIIYVSLSMAVLMGMIGLALDGSRAMITHSEAQSAADAAALAAASQLDGQTGDCTRATAQADEVANRHRFAEGGDAKVEVASVRCLATLPASDDTSLAAVPNADDGEARFALVTTQQLTHQNTLLRAISSNNSVVIQRTAVASFRRSLCAAAPVMMTCEGYSWTPGKAFDAWINDANLKGFISTCGNGAPCTQSTLASTQPNFCVVDNDMELVPGNRTNPARDGINTRFGINSTQAYPSDTNITDYKAYSSDLTGGTGWKCADYWAANHASDGLAKPAGCTNGTTSFSRYAAYQAERAADKIPTRGPSGLTTTEERRMLYLAIFDCASSGSPPKAFLKTFMISKAEAASEKHIYVEPIELVTSKTDPNVLHEEVQLYR